MEADTGSMEPEKRGRTLDRREGPPIFVRPRDGAVTGLIRVDVRTLTFFAVLLALVGLGGWLYLQQASEVAALAHEIRVLEREKERLHLEITALRGEVAMLGSLGRVLEGGKQLGYTLPDTFDRERRLRVVYEPLPAPTEEPAAPVATGGEPASRQAFPEDRAPGLVQRLVAQLRAWIAAPVEDDGTEPPAEGADQP